jgi:hypothetical protein
MADLKAEYGSDARALFSFGVCQDVDGIEDGRLEGWKTGRMGGVHSGGDGLGGSL